jgi:hypothetical protein
MLWGRCMGLLVLSVALGTIVAGVVTLIFPRWRRLFVTSLQYGVWNAFKGFIWLAGMNSIPIFGLLLLACSLIDHDRPLASIWLNCSA